jgi:hypothetical protein
MTRKKTREQRIAADAEFAVRVARGGNVTVAQALEFLRELADTAGNRRRAQVDLVELRAKLVEIGAIIAVSPDHGRGKDPDRQSRAGAAR